MQILTPLLFMTICDKNFYLGLFHSWEASTRRIPIFIARAQLRILHLIVPDHNSRQLLGLGETVSADGRTALAVTHGVHTYLPSLRF